MGNLSRNTSDEYKFSQFGANDNSFLTEMGQEIFNVILGHCKKMGIDNSIDVFELSMLANSFSLYAESAAYCNKNGVKMVFESDKKGKNGNENNDDKKGGRYEQICPEYTVMKNEYQNILKHSAKFGLNPGDRSKIFGIIRQKKKKETLTDGL